MMNPYKNAYEAITDLAIALMLIGFGRMYAEPAIVRQTEGWR